MEASDMNLKEKISRQHGFSLVELAVVMAIVGLLMAGMLQTYRVHKHRAEIEATNGRMGEASSALMLHLFSNKRLPCPAKRALPQDDDFYGRESCPGRTAMEPNFIALGDPCVDGLCRVPGQRVSDEFGNASGGATDTNLSAVLIGGLPFKELNTALNLSRQNVFDGWGRQFTYAVTERLTRPESSGDGYHSNAGTIGLRIWKPSGTAGEEHDPTKDIPQERTDPPNTQTAVLLSHGADGMGAYTSNGNLVFPCATGADTMRDSENCNDDSLFVMVDGNLISRKKNQYHYDDIVKDKFKPESFHWQSSTVNTDNIRTTLASFVGIGEDDPQAVIDVAGNIRIGDSTTNADLRVNNLCNQADTDCFDPNLIGGSGMICPLGQVLVGIANGSPNCQYTGLSNVNPNQDCSPDFVIGFETDGDVICGSPSL